MLGGFTMEERVLKELANVLPIKDYDSKEQLLYAIESDGNPATINSGPKFDWDVRYTKIRDVGIRNGMKALIFFVNFSRIEIMIFLHHSHLKVLLTSTNFLC